MWIIKYNLNTYPCLQLNNCVFATKTPQKTVLATKHESAFQNEIYKFFIAIAHWDSVELQGSWVKMLLDISLGKFRSVLSDVWQQNTLKKD